MKKYIISFMFVMFVSFSFMGIKAYAYSETAVTPEQLQTALTAFKNRIDTYSNWAQLLEGSTRYYTIFYDSSGYAIYMDTKRPVLIPSGTNPGNPFGYDPCLRVFPQSSGNYNVSMWINSDGSYTLPTSMYTGDSGQHDFWKNPDRSAYYTSYDLYNYVGNIWVRSAVPIGTKYCPTNAQVQGAEYKYDPTLVPTPANLRIKLITPTGLFPKIRETQVQLTWNPTSGALRTEVYILYTYKVGTDKVTKLLPYVTYSDGLFASVGTFTKLMNTDIEAFIHSKNTATAGQTFANGKLSFTHYYVRYVTPNSSALAYGNWVKIDVVTGGSILDTGDIVSQYNEVYTDENGDEIEVTDSEYNGIKVDTDGNTVDPTSLRTMEDYLLAIPNLMKNLFSGLSSMLNSVGNFGAFYSSAFSFLPPGVPLLITGAIAFVIAVGVIKILK